MGRDHNQCYAHRASNWHGQLSCLPVLLFLYQPIGSKVQRYRRHGDGNAVPSIKSADTEKVVLEGNSPAHAKYLLDARNIGYGLFPSEGSAPALSDDIKTALEPVWLQGKDITTTLASVAAMANPRVKAAQNNLQ